jgi:hypothetical protein
MSEFRDQLEEVLAATQITSATSFSWFGVRSEALPENAARMMDPATARAYLVYSLQARLYDGFYCAGRARAQVETPGIEPLPGHSPFVHALSAANAGRGARDPGWTVVGQETGTLVVERGGLKLWAAPHDVYATNGAGLAPGAVVSVLMPKELLRLSPGFYMALGEAEFPVDGSQPMVRFYWNVRSEGAPTLLSALTRSLNGEGIGFRLKVVSDPARYSRCDAGVLYTLRDDYKRLRPAVADAYRAVAPSLKPATPALAKRLAPGLALAEDPGLQAVSFGMSRCQILADAVVRAAEAGVVDPEVRMEIVRARFAEDGITLERPYLNPGSTDRYTFPAP